MNSMESEYWTRNWRRRRKNWKERKKSYWKRSEKGNM